MSATAGSDGLCPFSMFSKDLIDAPYAQYDKLRSEPFNWNDEVNGWIVTAFEAVRLGLDDPSLEAPNPADVIREIGRRSNRNYPALIQFFEAALFFQSGERHKYDRRTVSAVMNRIALSETEKIATALAGELAERIRGKQRYDVIRDFAEPLPQLVMASILGLPVEDIPRLGELLAELTLVFDPAPLAAYDRINRAIEEAADLFARRIAEADPASGLGLIFARTKGGGQQRLHAAAITALFVFRVGAETTIGLIGFVARALIDRPELREQLQREPDLVTKLVAEVLRTEASVQRAGRIAVEDCEIMGKPIAKGERLLLLVGAANRDPAHFPQPDAIELNRQSSVDVTFGIGVHSCPGASLARLEGRIAAQTFLQLPAVVRDGVESWFGGRTIRRLTALPVRTVPAHG